MAATRPSSAIRSGSSDTSSWWETKEFADLTEAGPKLRATSDFVGLEALYAEGYRRARALGLPHAQINYLTGLATARMLSSQYASALEAYLQASALAERWGDWFSLGGIAVNVAQVYQQLGDPRSALSALNRGKAAVDRLPFPPSYMAQLLMRLRSVQADLEGASGNDGDGPGSNHERPSYEDVIEAARQTEQPEVEALAWDLLGLEKITRGNLDEAESALGRALYLRYVYSRKTLRFSYSVLGHLRLVQADRAIGQQRWRRAREAEMLIERAMTPGLSPPLYVLLGQRGRARELQNQTQLALKDYRAAVDNASTWRGAVPAAQSLMTGVNIRLQHQVYDSFVEGAAREALRTGSGAWMADAFRALEANRAASLRDNRLLAPMWRKKLPAAYWETLGKLSQAEARNLGGGNTVTAESESLRLELTEMESLAGLGVSPISVENFRSQSSLSHFQDGLGSSDLVLSFYLGKRESYLWAVTHSSVAIYRLPAENRLRDEIERFRDGIIAGGREGEKLGADLYKQLFGLLKPQEAAKTSWLLSLDGPLFELPFPALVSGHKGGRPVFAAEGHSSQIIPGALFLARSSTISGSVRPGGYLGVGDAVYNSADSRWKTVRTWGTPVSDRSGKQQQLNRLVSTARELTRSSEAWHSATGSGFARPIQLLEGTAARRENFLDHLSPSKELPSPSTIHLATHVLTPETHPEQAFLAFSLDASGEPGLLSTAEVGMLHVPDALVVMTGCATAKGDIRAGAGMLGLTRAWMMAGARAVVATNWPVPDADGDLIPEFYRNLRDVPPAEALRRSQVAVIHSGTWQASPSYWAAFQVTGGGR